jgi:histone H3/H4
MITEKKIEAKDIKRLLLRVYRRYSSGAITEAQAHKETYLLNSILKAIEVTDLEQRITNLEDKL